MRWADLKQIDVRSLFSSTTDELELMEEKYEIRDIIKTCKQESQSILHEIMGRILELLFEAKANTRQEQNIFVIVIDTLKEGLMSLEEKLSSIDERLNKVEALAPID